jgi:hypothetical protein
MTKMQRFSVGGIVVGGLLTLGPVFGLLWTVLAVNRAFSLLGTTGIDNPKGFSDTVGGVLFGSATGLFLLPVGVIILALSVAVYNRNAPAPRPLPTGLRR